MEDSDEDELPPWARMSTSDEDDDEDGDSDDDSDEGSSDDDDSDDDEDDDSDDDSDDDEDDIKADKEVHSDDEDVAGAGGGQVEACSDGGSD